MNAAVMLAYNTTDAQLELTREAVASVLNQDIPTHLWIVNNGSTPPTGLWLDELLLRFPERVSVITNQFNVPPVRATNSLFHVMFGHKTLDHVLGCPNDAILPKHFYRSLLQWPRGIVTASETRDKDSVHFDDGARPVTAVAEHTPMAVALVRRWAYDAFIAKDGYFLDPRMEFYGSDCDLALRMAACGIRGIQLDLRYYHFGSGSHRLAAPGVGRGITLRADDDRAYFERKWGFKLDSPSYGEACGDINFRGEAKK